MASILKVDKLDPQSGTALEVGTSGDTITAPTGVNVTLTDEVKTNKISPATGTAFTLGDSGDTFTVPSGGAITNSGTATGFFNDDAILNDIGVLALNQAVTNNKAAYNLPNELIDQYEDSSAIENLSNVSRNASEYISTNALLSSNFDFTAGDGSLQVTEADIAMDNRATFTQEAWVLVTSATTNASEQSGVWGSAGQDGVGTSIELNSGSNQYIYIRVATEDASPGDSWKLNASTGDASPSPGWHHYAEVVASDTYTLYQDGTNIYSGALDSGDIKFGTVLALGVGAYGGDRWCKAMMNDWRISSTARYTTNFTPSTNAFVSDSDTLILVQSNTTNGSTTFTDSGPNGETITKSGGSVDNSTDDASNLSIMNAAGSYTSTNQTANATVSKGGIVVLYKNASGTATLNTDLIAKISANGGTNYETVTLTALGTFSTGILMASAQDVTISNTGTSMKYKIEFANQASGSKETQVWGVAFQY